MAHFIIVLAALLALATSHSSFAAAVSDFSLAKLKTITAIRTAAPPSSPLSAAAKEFLNSHNDARAAVGVPPLAWSQSLANATSRLGRYQRNQKNCDFASVQPGKYGANQLWARGTAVVTPRQAVAAWVNEKKFYNYGTNTCAENHTCGVYKQVVWRNSKELGCSLAACAKNQITLAICFYNPPGNIIGERPY